MEELKSPGTQFRVIMYVGTNVPGIHTTSIFRVKNILQPFYPEDGGSRFNQKADTCPPNYTTSLPGTSVLLFIVAKTAKLSVNYWHTWQTCQDLTTKGDVAPPFSQLTANQDRISAISLSQSLKQILVGYNISAPHHDLLLPNPYLESLTIIFSYHSMENNLQSRK